MVTSYYLMKMCKNKLKIDTFEYYSKLFKPVRDKSVEMCRICLQEGKHSIYGENMEISKVLLSLSGIQISEDDELPQQLCEVCFNFLSSAMMFRKTAKRSDEILRQFTKKEPDLEDDSISAEPNVPSDTASNFNDDVYDSNGQEDVKDTPKKPTKVTCNICKKVMNRNYYKCHITMHKPNNHAYVCEICGKSFRLGCSYYNHKARHGTDFPYKCQYCPYRGRYPELLRNHMKTHSGDYRYMCTECPARFRYKSNLNSHMRKHKDPQFKCDLCKRAFHSKLMLQRHHEADHLGIKNHVCSICGKAFGYRNAMMKHQRHVHKREKISFGRMPSYLIAEHKMQNV